MINDFLKVFAVNLQTIPNLGNIIEGGNALIFFMWITLTLPSYEIMLTECSQRDRPSVRFQEFYDGIPKMPSLFHITGFNPFCTGRLRHASITVRGSWLNLEQLEISREPVTTVGSRFFTSPIPFIFCSYARLRTNNTTFSTA